MSSEASDPRSHFELSAPDMGFLTLVWSDYKAHQADNPEPVWRMLLLMVPRLVVNPSLQFALLVRVAQKGPRLLQVPVRWLQVVLFSSEVYWFKRDGGITIGAGIVFPHPMNIIIGPGTRIGTGVRIYNCTNIGADRDWTSRSHPASRAVEIGNGATIYGYATVQGPYRVGHGGVIGVRVFLDEDVPNGALKTRRRVRLAGEWKR